MKKSFYLFLLLFLLVATSVEARSGCCSHHGGVCGCGCCDGSGLSSTCLPYYPECSGGGVQEIYTPPTSTPRPWPTLTPAPTWTPRPLPTNIFLPTRRPSPTRKPFPTIRVSPTATATPTPTLLPTIASIREPTAIRLIDKESFEEESVWERILRMFR